MHTLRRRSEEEKSMDSGKKSKATLSRRFFRELNEFALLTAYFWVVFATVVLLKATVLHSYGVHYVVWGAAIVKAVLIAKFMLIGRAMKIGDGYLDAPLIKPILHKIFGFMVLLLVLTSVQGMAVDLFHHRSIPAMFHEVAGPSLGQTLAEVLVLLLVLVPFVAFSVFGEALGEGSLRRMLFTGGTPRLVGFAKGDPSQKSVDA
jgi:hypothetical protein